jgi:hypothetical protein
MPFPVKYNSGNVTGSIIKGNVALAVNDIVGPTSVTGWYNGPNFTQGTYQIVETSASGDPDVYCPRNEAELVRFVKSKGALSGVTGSSTDALVWIGTQPNLLAINEVYPNIVTDGDILNLDAGFAGSYPVDPFQVNLLYNNGVYTPGSGVSGFDNLGLWVTASVIIPNNRFRISTGTVFRSGTEQSLRFNVPLSVLTNYQSYNLSFNYQIISGSLFSMTDWNDRVLSNNVNINYGSYQYSASTGTTTGATPVGTYNSTYRFMDFAFGTGSIVDIWDIQLTQNVSASLFNTGSRNTWYDISGNNRTGSLVNGTSFNTNNYMVLDGVDDYISLNASQSLTNNYTLRFLFKTNTTAASTAYFQMLNSLSPTSQNSIKLEWNNRLLAYNNSSSLQAYAFIFPLVPAFNLSRSFSDMQITVDSNNIMTVYNNGVACTPTTGVTGSIDFQVLGRAQGTYLAESIAGFQLYNRVLSQAEINQNYYQAPIVTNSLIFTSDAGNLVSFERGSTTTYSLTGSATGSLINSTGYTSSNGGSWVFDGVDDYVIFTSSSILQPSSSITLESFFQRDSGRTIINYGADGGGASKIYCFEQFNAASSLLAKVTTTVNGQVTLTGPILPTGSWSHVAMTYNGSTASLYINGSLYTSSTASGDISYPVNASLNLGRKNAVDGEYINGKIAVTRIYNRGLTAAEISQNYNAQKGRFGL